MLGIDPSSACCGVALMEDDTLLLTDAWHRPKTGSSPARLSEYFDWLTFFVFLHKPDIACIEYLSVVRNAQVTRVISHYQAVSALVCKQANLVVIEGRATSARKASLGRGNMSKEECFDAIRAKFPDHDFGRKSKTSGAMDKTDAVVLALACAELAEG